VTIKSSADRSQESDWLDDFAPEPDEGRTGQTSTSAWETRIGADSLETPPPTPVRLTESEGLNAFADEQWQDELAQAAPEWVTPSDVAIDGIATETRPSPPLVIIGVDRSVGRRSGAYLYAAVLILLTGGLLILLRPVVTQPAADQAALTHNEASAALTTAQTPHITPALPDPPTAVARENATPPIEASWNTGLTPAPQPVPQRVAPAVSARAERKIEPETTRPPRSFPASQTRSVPVPASAVTPNLAAGSASVPAAIPEAAVPPAPPPTRAATAAPTVNASAPAAPSSSATAPIPTAVAPAATAPAAAATTSAPPPAPVTNAPPPAPVTNAPPPASVATGSASASPATPAPASAAPSNTAPAASALEIDMRAIRQVLERYRTAINARDANAAQDAWPGVNQRALARAFEGLDEQDVSFQDCRIDVNRAQASAICGGVARYVPRVGRRTERVERREWTFQLRREQSGWFIEGIRTR